MPKSEQVIGGINPRSVIITDFDVANLNFPEGLNEIYCFRKDEDGNVVEYACLMSNLGKVIIVKDLLKGEYEIYYNDCKHDSYPKLVVFLSSLLTRDTYLKGKPYEKKIGEMSWRVFSPQKRTPNALRELINKIIPL